MNHGLDAGKWRKLGLSVDSVYCSSEKRTIRVEDGMTLFPCFQAVPMGWTWALWLCKEAVLNITQKYSPWVDGILRESKCTPQLSEHRTVIGVYVDNITVLGQNYHDVEQRAKLKQLTRHVLMPAFQSHGLRTLLPPSLRV